MATTALVALGIGRGTMIAIAVILGTFYTLLKNQQQRRRIQVMMEGRAADKRNAHSELSEVEAAVRLELEQITQLDLTHIAASDKLSTFLQGRDARRVIEHLEEKFDVALPDSWRVMEYTLGEFIQVIERAIKRERSSAKS